MRDDRRVEVAVQSHGVDRHVDVDARDRLSGVRFALGDPLPLGGVGAADWHADGCVHEEEGVRLRCHDVVKDASEVRARGDAPSRAAKARGCEVVRHDQVEERDCDGARAERRRTTTCLA